MAPCRVRWIERVDLAIYPAVAGTPTPAPHGAMSRLSRAADYSRLSLAAAAALVLTGAQAGGRAASHGLVSLAVTATVVNLVVKPPYAGVGRGVISGRVARGWLPPKAARPHTTRC